jgi:redox-sensitive bicupin YhaK (pirin superfamily)
MGVTVVVRRALDRFTSRAAGRETRHSFSFGASYDPDRVAFGPLIALNDDLLGSTAGYEPHAHVDVEVVTWVVSGALEHRDESGVSRLGAGEVAVTSAGTGTTHAERAAGEVTRFIQMWLTPDDLAGEPHRAVATPDLGGEDWVPLVGTGGLPIRTAGADLAVAALTGGTTIALPNAPRTYLFVVTGALARSSLAEPLVAGDAFEITGESGLKVTAAVPSQLLAWQFHPTR